MLKCGLCQNEESEIFYCDEREAWTYFICKECSLVFRDPETYIDAVEEKARYETHNNSIEDQGYVDFLMPAAEAVLPHLERGALGLDFGSGPGPIMDQLFARHGLEVVNYDPFFAPNPEGLNKSYDFVTCTEAFEHFYHPSQEMDLMSQMLKPGGYLVLMSDFRRSAQEFATWSYRKDNTHVCFLSEPTLEWLARQWSFELLSTDGRVSLLKKKS